MPSDEHEQIVELMRAQAAEPADHTDVAAARASLDALGGLFAVPDSVRVEPDVIDGVAVEWMRPAGDERRGLIQYHHGGSYLAGSLDSHRALVGRLAAATGCDVLAVDYRLAPEHPFPAGLDDARTVYRSHLDRGVDPSELFVAGDSAGGGLTLALLLSLRDGGIALPRGGVLLSPWLDLTLSGESVSALAEDDPMLRSDALAWAADAYAGGRLDDPLVSPHLADLAGLPPLLALVGTREILLDDSRGLTEQAAGSGADVTVDVHDGLVHVWPFIDGIPESAAALDRITSWVADRLS